MKPIFKGYLAAVLLMSFSTVFAEPPEISSARIIQPPPGAKVAAAFLTVRNNTDVPLQITGASSEAIPKVSLHLSAIVNDVAKMIHQDSVTVEPRSSLEFKHGSYHFMLMGLKDPLIAGSMLAFEIETSVGVVPLMIPIITLDEASTMKSHSMDHDDMKKGSELMENNNSMNHSDMDASKSTDKN